LQIPGRSSGAEMAGTGQHKAGHDVNVVAVSRVMRLCFEWLNPSDAIAGPFDKSRRFAG